MRWGDTRLLIIQFFPPAKDPTLWPFATFVKFLTSVQTFALTPPLAFRTCPSAPTGRTSGWRSTSHLGGVAVGVPSGQLLNKKRRECRSVSQSVYHWANLH